VQTRIHAFEKQKQLRWLFQIHSLSKFTVCEHMVIHLLNQKIAMNVADSVINSVFISLHDQMIKQDDKHGFIKH
jgi:hypothetical protein